MDWILPLIAGLGLGSILKSLIDYFMNRRATARDRWYQEKRETYLGLLSALQEVAASPSHEKSTLFAVWKARCDLFGSGKAAQFAQDMVDTNPGSDERKAAFRGLINAMKEDLRK